MRSPSYLNPFAFVRLGFADGADFGSHFADQFLVDALDDDLACCDGTSNSMPLFRHNFHRMGIADVQHEFVARFARPVSDADEFQRLAETFRYAADHVGDDAARRAVQGTMQFIIGRTFNVNFVVFDC